MLTTLVSVLLATVEGTVALTLMTVQEWSAQETALALIVLTFSCVFATTALKEKTALVRKGRECVPCALTVIP